MSCHWSRLTINSCLLHACSRACFVHSMMSLMTRSIVICLCSRLTINSCLLHACSRACFICIIVADSLQVSFKQTHYRVTDLMTRSIIICSCSRLTIEWRAQWRDQSFFCHCSRLTSDSDLLHSIMLVSFMSLKQTHYFDFCLLHTLHCLFCSLIVSMTRSILNTSL